MCSLLEGGRASYQLNPVPSSSSVFLNLADGECSGEH